MHVLIDSCIYRQDRRRNKPAFRAIVRLAKAGRLGLHLPAFVKGEVLTQELQDTRDEIAKIRGAAAKLLRITNEPKLRREAAALVATATSMRKQADNGIPEALARWIEDADATVHPVAADHGARVAAAYFAGATPFRASKYREDLPDSFIWETALDILREYDELTVISSDERLYNAAEENEHMTAYKSLDAFIEDDDCQDSLADLRSAALAHNIERIKQLLPAIQATLHDSLNNDIVGELAWKTVRHDAIPDDNNEATIVMVGAAENLDFTFQETEHYSDADLGIPYTASVECELNYTVYKGDFYILPHRDEIAIDEWNDHYFDAHQTYRIDIEGYLNLIIDPERLQDDDLTDDDLKDIINDADTSTEITERTVNIPEY